jgi:hypothetical protein
MFSPPTYPCGKRTILLKLAKLRASGQAEKPSVWRAGFANRSERHRQRFAAREPESADGDPLCAFAAAFLRDNREIIQHAVA